MADKKDAPAHEGRDYQDYTIGRLMRSRQTATLFMCNRQTMRGRIITFDQFVVLLEPLRGGPLQLVYKSAMVAVCGPRWVDRRDGPRRRGDEHRGRGPRHGPREQGRPHEGGEHLEHGGQRDRGQHHAHPDAHSEQGEG